MTLPKRKVQKSRDDKICDMVKEGYTYDEIAKTFKISRQRAHQIYKKYYPQGTGQMLDTGGARD